MNFSQQRAQPILGSSRSRGYRLFERSPRLATGRVGEPNISSRGSHKLRCAPVVVVARRNSRRFSHRYTESPPTPERRSVAANEHKSWPRPILTGFVLPPLYTSIFFSFYATFGRYFGIYCYVFRVIAATMTRPEQLDMSPHVPERYHLATKFAQELSRRRGGGLSLTARN